MTTAGRIQAPGQEGTDYVKNGTLECHLPSNTLPYQISNMSGSTLHLLWYLDDKDVILILLRKKEPYFLKLYLLILTSKVSSRVDFFVLT